MSEVLSSIGQLFSKANLGTTLSGLNVGMGALGNLLAGRQQQQAYNEFSNQEKAIANMSPADLTKRIQAAEAPINQGLIQGVDNSVQADLASRGLAQAPGIFASEESQAIAPILQGNYNTALSQVMQQLNIPLQYAYVLNQYLPKGQPLTPSAMMFLQSLSKRLNGGGGGGGGFPTTGPNPPSDTPVLPDWAGSTAPTDTSGLAALLG